MDAIGTAQRNDSWAILGRELYKRTLEPCAHASFVIYFFVAVVLLGGIGVWMEMHSYYFYMPKPEEPEPSAAALRIAVISFFPALAGSSCMQLILAEDYHKSLRAFAIAALALVLLGVLVMAPIAVSHKTALIVGAIASAFALWMWWIANAKQRDLLDPDAPVGNKDPTLDLPGTLDGFKT